jgi:type I restriction enzyme S subunit
MLPLRHLISDYIGGGWGKEAPDQEHNVPALVIRGTDLASVRLGALDDVPYRWHKLSNARSRTLRAGDIIFEVSGGSKDQPVGRSLLLDGKRVAQFHAASIPASFCKKIRPDQAKVDPYFLWAHLQLAWMDRRILKWQVQSTGISNFNFESFLDDFALDLPSLPAQRRIASILSAYDELIDNSQRRIKILESMARAFYREWFVHFRFPGHESVPRVPSPLGEIPQGWEVKPVDEAFEISGGGTPSRKEGDYWEGGTIQWYSPSDLTAAGTMFIDDSSDHITEVGLAQSLARMFSAGSVMLTSRATIGAIAINTQPACTNQGFITRMPNDQVPLYFLFHWLADNVPTFQRMASGATFKEISRGVFKTIEVLQPSSTLVGQFEVAVTPMARNVLALQRQVQNLRRTRDLLLPRLLSGGIPLDLEAVGA